MIRQIWLLFLTGFVLTLATTMSVSAHSVGEVRPSCILTSLEGEHVYNLQELKGKVIYVDFWASWCPPCVRSFPFLNQLEHDLKDQGLQVIGINLDEKLMDAKKFLDKYPAGFTIALDPDKQCARDFGVIAMPTSYIIDQEGIIRHVHQGFRSGDKQELRGVLEHLLTESL